MNSLPSPALPGPGEATTLSAPWGTSTWTSSVAPAGSFAPAEEAARADFELAPVPLPLERHPCRRHGEGTFSAECLPAYVRGEGRCCAGCPVALPAYFALGIDRALATLVQRGPERNRSKSRLYGRPS